MKLSIVRNGQFHANFKGNMAAKCDLETVHYYTYQVAIEATDQSLSPEGFIIENSRIQSYFERAYAEPVEAQSCERIAIAAATGLAALMLAERISITTVRVTVTGSNGALLSATWEKDARLIAPAPELVKALQRIAAWEPSAAPNEPGGMSIMDAIDTAVGALSLVQDEDPTSTT